MRGHVCGGTFFIAISKSEVDLFSCVNGVDSLLEALRSRNGYRAVISYDDSSVDKFILLSLLAAPEPSLSVEASLGWSSGYASCLGARRNVNVGTLTEAAALSSPDKPDELTL